MAAIVKIIKNPSLTNAVFSIQPGVSILPNSSYTVPYQEFPLWVGVVDALISAGTVVINDGTSDLSPVAGIALINGIPAKYTSFDNLTNGFAAINSQQAIEEAKLTARGAASRYVVSFSQTGGTASGSYVRNAGGNASNVNPFVVPEISKLIGISVSVATLQVGLVTFSVIKNGSINIGSVTIPINSFIASNNNLSANLVVGDYLALQCTSGLSGAPAVNIFIQTS